MDDDFKNMVDNSDFDIAYEKLFEPSFYEDELNYTVGKAFAISNEQLAKVFRNINLDGKRVLTVGSSGDQALNSILKGASDITIVDINVFSEPFIEYKLAVIKTFDFKTFNELFVKPRMFNYKVYSKISHLLTKKAQIFWDQIMLDLDSDNTWYKFNENKVAGDMLIIDHTTRFSEFYKNEKVYKKLQNILRSGKVSIRYVTAELQDFVNVSGKYDLIYLSNIYDYYKVGKKVDIFEQVVKTLYDSHLTDGGKVVVNYDFCYGKDKAPNAFIGKELSPIEVERWDCGKMVKDTIWFINKPLLNKNEETEITK